MTDYVREVKRQLRDVYHFVPSGGTESDPTFDNMPDGEYPMTIGGKRDHVKIVDGRFRLCNFDE